MQRNNAIDCVKGFAILLVMVGHCIVLNGLDRTDPFIYDMIKSVQMPLFMLVSGVLASVGVRRYGKGSGFQKLSGRTVSYLVPFFSWFVLVYLYTHIKDGTLSFSGFVTELKALLFQTDRGLWFLMTLFVATLCAMVAQKIADMVVKISESEIMEISQKNIVLKACVFVIVSLGLYALFFLQSRSGNTFLSPSLMLQYFPFYLMGYVVNGYVLCVATSEGKNRKWLRSKSFRTAETVVIALMSVLFLAMVFMLDLSQPVDGIRTLVVQMAASLLGTVSCYMIVYRVSKLQSKKTEKRSFLSFIGLYTLEIYVVHFRFARLLGLADKNLQLYSLRGIFWLVLSFVVMSLLTALTIWVIRRIPGASLLLFGKSPTKISSRKASQRA